MIPAGRGIGKVRIAVRANPKNERKKGKPAFEENHMKKRHTVNADHREKNGCAGAKRGA